ncbi:MAG: M23 family metallopeptidase [Cyanobacteria bacterium P01_E01_bin.35]
MVRNIALGILMAGIMPITLASSTTINDDDREGILAEKKPILNDFSTGFSCTIINLLNNCLANSYGFEKKQFAIQVNLWQSKIINSTVPNSIVGTCLPHSFQNSKYSPQSLSQQRQGINQPLKYYLPSRGAIDSSVTEPLFSSLVQLVNPRCSFSEHRQLEQQFPKLAPLKAKKFTSHQSLFSHSFTQSKFPQLSRSSLIVDFPYQNSTFVPQNTKFAIPAPQTKRIASSFGWRRRPFSNQLQFHQGIDYGAPYGSPVVAVGNGIVTKVVSDCADFGNLFCGGQLGNWIEVDHGNGTIGIYGHLKNSSIKVKEGMKVWKNQNIALVGSSGWSTGAHLDFRLKIDGKHKDPAKYVMAIGENL